MHCDIQVMTYSPFRHLCILTPRFYVKGVVDKTRGDMANISSSPEGTENGGSISKVGQSQKK